MYVDIESHGNHSYVFFEGALAFSNSYFGRGTGPTLLYNVGCGGSEVDILHCSHSGIGVFSSYYCNGHSNDAGVLCQGFLR